MKTAYLEVTYRHGRPIAAYYYLPRRNGDRSARTVACDGGLVIDLTEDGRAIGVEITAPSSVDATTLNAALAQVGQPPIAPDELAPLSAA